MSARRKTHCVHGHELAGDNLYIIPSTGQRQCRACHTESRLKYYTRNAATIRGKRNERYNVVRQAALAVAPTQGVRAVPTKLFAIQVEWPLTLCNELPWSCEFYSTYKPVYG